MVSTAEQRIAAIAAFEVIVACPARQVVVACATLEPVVARSRAQQIVPPVAKKNVICRAGLHVFDIDDSVGHAAVRCYSRGKIDVDDFSGGRALGIVQ